jgi:hypothetical protein
MEGRPCVKKITSLKRQGPSIPEMVVTNSWALKGFLEVAQEICLKNLGSSWRQCLTLMPESTPHCNEMPHKSQGKEK